MPPAAVKTVRDLVYWEYAKLASEIAVGDRKNFRYAMATYQRYRRISVHPLSILHENGLESKGLGECCYCGSQQNLQMDYIVPVSAGGPDRPDNLIDICDKCRQSKGKKELFHWFGKERRYEIPRLILGKYLKLVFEAHEANGTLDSTDVNKDGKLDIFDLGAAFPKRSKGRPDRAV